MPMTIASARGTRPRGAKSPYPIVSPDTNLVQTKLAHLRADRFGGQAPRAAGLPHEQRPEPPLGFVGVVRRAAQFEIVDSRRPAIGEGNAVMELEPGRLGATAFGSDEGASIPIACADRASKRGGNIA